MAAAHDLDTVDVLNWRENTQSVTERADADFEERGGAVKACCSDESSHKNNALHYIVRSQGHFLPVVPKNSRNFSGCAGWEFLYDAYDC